MPEITPDLQALLDRVAEGAAHSCGADDAFVRVLEGEYLRRVAHFGTLATLADGDVVHASYAGEAFRQRRTVHIVDATDADASHGSTARAARELGIRTQLSTPLAIGDRVLGTIIIRRTEVRPFTDEQIAQLETYAQLAAIALDRAQLAAENARLLGELHETLEHQSATAEVLGIIARSPTDLQPVLSRCW